MMTAGMPARKLHKSERMPVTNEAIASLLVDGVDGSAGGISDMLG